jgi:hypothetical protein
MLNSFNSTLFCNPLKNWGKCLLNSFSSFSGLNQLLWYYADMEKKKCIEDMNKEMHGMHGRKSSKVRNNNKTKNSLTKLLSKDGV